MKSNQEKLMFMENKFNDLKRKMIKYYEINKYENCLATISVYSQLQYKFNQTYCDYEIEELVNLLSKRLLPNIDKYIANKQTVMFYDGFGLDLRGWAASYVRALHSLNYRVIYVTTDKSKGKIPHIIKELGDNIVEYIDMSNSYINWTKSIYDIFVKYKPSTAFFYTVPNDISAAIAFNKFSNRVTRFQVDLTDHAYWLGMNSTDYFLECRELGAGLAVYKRGASKDKIIKIDCAPYINREICDKELPFDIEKEKYIFTGGSLYKTLGDEELLYYKIIDTILKEFRDIKFLYAGTGDDSQMQVLIEKYPGRVFLIDERPDYFRLIENCEFYLNTYPMFGGLMMRYAALAKKIPLTLKHEHDSDGILENQEFLNIEFDNIEDLLIEVRKLLNEKEYCKLRGMDMQNAVITEEVFARNIGSIIQNQKSEFVFEDIKYMDTSEFQREYVERFETEMFYEVCARKNNKKMLFILPISYIRGILIKIRKRMKRK